MSANPITKECSVTRLTREQLLEALDTDIDSIVAMQSAEGLNNWAILGASATLLWIALDAWEQGHFILRNIFILTLALTFTWDWLRWMAPHLDSPPIGTSQSRNRFWSITVLLGSSRTAIVFGLAKMSLSLAIVFYINSPFSFWLRIYFGIEILFRVLALLASYLSAMPEISPESKITPYWAIRTGLVLVGIWAAGAGILSWGIVWLNKDQLTTRDWRMGLVFSALIYLISKAVQNRIPANFLNAYKILRRNLAYGLISLEDARNQADILSIGGTKDQTLSPYLKTCLNALDQAELASARARHKVMAFADSVAEWANIEESPEAKEKQMRSIKLQNDFSDELKNGLRLMIKTKKLLVKFEARVRYLATTSPEPVESVETLVAKLGKKLDQTEISFNQTEKLLDLSHQVITIRKDENALREKLAKLNDLRGNMVKGAVQVES